MDEKEICAFGGCDRVRTTKGLCKAHYNQRARGGALRPLNFERINSGTASEFFWSRTSKGATCWLWTGRATRLGYGQMRIDGKSVYSHRFVFEMLRGPIPPGMVVDHLCHNTSCVNPDHLRLATHNQNEQNRKGASAQSESGLRNVWQLSSGKWRAAIKKDGITHQKNFTTASDADNWATQKRSDLFGEFAGKG